MNRSANSQARILHTLGGSHAGKRAGGGAARVWSSGFSRPGVWSVGAQNDFDALLQGHVPPPEGGTPYAAARFRVRACARRTVRTLPTRCLGNTLRLVLRTQPRSGKSAF